MQSNITPEAIKLMGTVCDEVFSALRQTTFLPNDQRGIRSAPSNGELRLSRSLRWRAQPCPSQGGCNAGSRVDAHVVYLSLSILKPVEDRSEAVDTSNGTRGHLRSF